jgi:hypothetical protein
MQKLHSFHRGFHPDHSGTGLFFRLTPKEQRERVCQMLRARFDVETIAEVTGWTRRKVARAALVVLSDKGRA